VALGPEAGLKILAQEGPFPVVISDMRMPVMDGVRFLAKVKERAPDSVRIMLTGATDQQTAMDAVNEGSIFRFLTKPCPPDKLARAIGAGIDQHRLVTAERDLLEKTLRGSVKVLTDVLSLVNPMAFGRASRVVRLVRQICTQLDVARPWQAEMAAMLSQVGCVALPQATLQRVYQGAALSDEERRMFQDHPRIGSGLIANIPRLERIAQIIADQEKPLDDPGGEKIPLEARILHVALDYDTLVAAGRAHWDAVEEIRSRDGRYDADVLEALARIVAAERQCEYTTVGVEDLTTPMILAEDVRTTSGLLLIAKGQEVNPTLCERLRNFVQMGEIVDRFRVFIPR
jgi:response regulator RpfG family c-di-GMP phosphodiesterase